MSGSGRCRSLAGRRTKQAAAAHLPDLRPRRRRAAISGSPHWFRYGQGLISPFVLVLVPLVESRAFVAPISLFLSGESRRAGVFGRKKKTVLRGQGMERSFVLVASGAIIIPFLGFSGVLAGPGSLMPFLTRSSWHQTLNYLTIL